MHMGTHVYTLATIQHKLVVGSVLAIWADRSYATKTSTLLPTYLKDESPDAAKVVREDKALCEVQRWSPLIPNHVLFLATAMWETASPMGKETPRSHGDNGGYCGVLCKKFFLPCFCSVQQNRINTSVGLGLWVLWEFKTVRMINQSVSVFSMCSYPPKSTCSTLYVCSQHKSFKTPDRGSKR